MILPDDSSERAKVFRNILRECDGDREGRRARHLRYRALLLLGTDGMRQARYNKLAEHVDTSSSFIYSATAVRFNAVLPPIYGDEFLAQLEAASAEMHRVWHDTDAGMTFGLGVKWAHADDSSIFKVITEGGEPRLELIADPSDVGVWRPDHTEWARQECVAHWFYVDLPTFARYLRGGIPNMELRKALWAEASEHASPRQSSIGDALPESVHGYLLNISQSTPNMSGSLAGGVNALPNFSMGRPDIRADLVQMAELWVLDDKAAKDPKSGEWIADYVKVWMFVPTERVMWEDGNPLISGEHPFHGLTLGPVPGYAWGRCPLELLVPLQDWRELRMNQVDRLMGLQLDPPMLFKGFAGELSELRKRFWTPGGTQGSPPGIDADIKNMAPAMPPEAFAEIHELDRMFAAAGGLPLGSQGRTEPGVRSGEQAQVQAQLGAGPTADRAMLVERVCENIATQMLRLRRKALAETLKTHGGEEFLLAQIPSDVVIRVSAHSASPLYGQEVKKLAVLALDKGVIDAEDFIELIDLPGKDKLIPKARQRAAAKAEMAKKALAIKETEATAKQTTAQAKAQASEK